MNTRTILLPVILLLILSSWTSPLSAAWPADGILVCGAEGPQHDPLVVPDGAGGMILVWQDERTGTDIYAQRLDGSGNAIWAGDGINLSHGDIGYLLGLVTDDAGGAIVVWNNAVTVTLTATRISPDGSQPWGAGGSAVGTDGPPLNVAAAPDGSGGVLIAWSVYKSGVYDPYVQKLDSNGIEMWTTDGLIYSGSHLPADYTPDIVSDGAGGAIIAFMTDNFQIFVQRVFSNESLWSASGTQADYTTGPVYPNYNPAVTLDGAGGAYVAWQRADPGVFIYAQKISASGNRLFASSVRVSNASGVHKNPDILSDGAGGACIAWENNRNSDFDIYAQRMDAFGNELWDVDGLPVCEAEEDQFDAVLVSSSPLDFILAWTSDPLGGPGSGNLLLAQKLDFGGAAQWTADGVQVLEGDGDEGYDFAADGSGGMMATISSDRWLGSAHDIYAQSINNFGDPAAAEPVITDIADVPDDEGGWVRITIGSSDRDRLEQDFEQVTYYDIWQRIDDLSMIPALPDPASDSKSISISGAAVDRVQITVYESGSRRFIVAPPAGEFPAGTWEFIGSFGGSQADEYVFRASTLTDMIGTTVQYSVFTVAARTTNPSVWFVSSPDSGYSIDNLAPTAPLSLAGEQSYSPEGLQLTWDDNSEDDLSGYRVYRGISEDFLPVQTTLVGSPYDSELFDDQWSWDAGYWYKVAAVDRHDNESPMAVIGPDQVTGDDPMPVPDATFLEQNFPNPFNPSTTIAFGLKSAGFVNLSIYDAAGRLVATLINESRPAGQYATVWNGNDRNGSSAASGVYFYRLTTKKFEETRKMILLQ